jgi:hypothetical protein
MVDKEVHSLNKLLDKLVDDFRYTIDFALDLICELPNYFFWDDGKPEKIKQIKEIYKTLIVAFVLYLIAKIG